MTTPPSLADLLPRLRAFFAARGAPAYLVGGTVRDGLLGRHARVAADLDLVIEGDAAALTRALADELGWAYVPLHETFPVARAALPGAPGRDGVTIDISGAVNGLRADLLRRDFTVNALAVPLAAFTGDWTTAPVIDLAGGRADLERRVLRAVSSSAFREDPLRMLRAVRLAAELDFTIAPETAALVRRDAALVRKVAGERVREELLRTLAAPGVVASLRRMDDLGLLDAVLPEVALGRGVAQPKEHQFDVLDHNIYTAGVLQAMLTQREAARDDPNDPLHYLPWRPELDAYFAEVVASGHTRGTLLVLAGLLHDVAKPQTKGPDATGRIRFLGHAELGAEIAGKLMARLRFGTRETRAVQTMIEHHLRPGQLSAHWQLPTDRAVYRYLRDVGAVALDTLYLNLADHLAARGPALRLPNWIDHCQLTARVLDRAFAERERPAPRLVTGHDIMEHFGLPPGPQVGRLVEVAREAQAAGEIATRDEALALVARHLAAAPTSRQSGDERRTT